MNDDELRIKELKLVGKGLYIARLRRDTYVVTKPYEAEDIEDAKYKAWDAETETESDEGGMLFEIKDVATGEITEVG